MKTPFKFVASEYSDHVINLNKLEDRNLEVRLTQINKEMTVSLNLIKRDYNDVKRKVDENTEAIELVRRRNKQMYDENLRKLLKEVNDFGEETEASKIYNAAKYRAFFEWASSPDANRRISRNLSKSRQIAARLSLSASAESRRSSRKSITKLPASLRQILNKQDSLMRTNSSATPAPEDVVAAANAIPNAQKRGSIKKEVTIEIDSSNSSDTEINVKSKAIVKETEIVKKKPPKPVRPATAGNTKRIVSAEATPKNVTSTPKPPPDENYSANVKTVTYNRRSLCLSAPIKRSSHVNSDVDKDS